MIHQSFQKCQWKMLSNPDPNKQALEVHFAQKRDKENYPSLTFNGDKVQSVPCQKHLGLILDSKLDFNEQITIRSVNVIKQ